MAGRAVAKRGPRGANRRRDQMTAGEPADVFEVSQERRDEVGDGRSLRDGKPQAAHMVKQRVQEMGLDDVVEVMGVVPFEEMSDFYASAGVFLFTSLQDTNGSVLLEAMAHALPVVSLDHHGAAAILSPEWGVKVPIGSPAQTVDDMASALQVLAEDPERRQRLGLAARRRVEQRYTWEHKAAALNRAYAVATQEKPATAENRIEPTAVRA